MNTDMTMLRQLVEDLDKIDTSCYAGLSAALEEARALLGNQEATQRQVLAAYNKLVEATGELEIGYIHDAHKPAPRGYLAACSRMGLLPEETACIGDQLFTDVLGANRAGVRSILVLPVDRSTDIPRIRLKRRLEAPILKAYEKHYGGPEGR